MITFKQFISEEHDIATVVSAAVKEADRYFAGTFEDSSYRDELVEYSAIIGKLLQCTKIQFQKFTEDCDHTSTWESGFVSFIGTKPLGKWSIELVEKAIHQRAKQIFKDKVTVIATRILADGDPLGTDIRTFKKKHADSDVSSTIIVYLKTVPVDL